MFNDRVIRKILKNKLQADLKKGAKIIDEFGIFHGSSRIDIAAVTDSFLYGYEIKSDHDTLLRLPNQERRYSKVFDEISLVVGKKHIIEAMYLVPDWWGIIAAQHNTNNEIVLYTIRKPEKNPTQSKTSIAQLLWRNEALNILKERKKDVGFRSKSRSAIYEQVASVLRIDEIKQEVWNYLKYSAYRHSPAVQQE